MSETNRPGEGEFVFQANPPENIRKATGSDAPIEILRLCPNGDIYVHGRLTANDKDVVDGMRELLRRDGET
jgi:hypothetical protein